MTIVMCIRVHPYKATHFENRKCIFHFIAFMVLHKDFSVLGKLLFKSNLLQLLVTTIKINFFTSVLKQI